MGLGKTTVMNDAKIHGASCKLVIRFIKTNTKNILQQFKNTLIPYRYLEKSLWSPFHILKYHFEPIQMSYIYTGTYFDCVS